VTVALSAEQFAWLKSAIANQRKVWELLVQMQELTLQHMWKKNPWNRSAQTLVQKDPRP